MQAKLVVEARDAGTWQNPGALELPVGPAACRGLYERVSDGDEEPRVRHMAFMALQVSPSWLGVGEGGAAWEHTMATGVPLLARVRGLGVWLRGMAAREWAGVRAPARPAQVLASQPPSLYR
jgi:hypothetical protein